MSITRFIAEEAIPNITTNTVSNVTTVKGEDHTRWQNVDEIAVPYWSERFIRDNKLPPWDDYHAASVILESFIRTGTITKDINFIECVDGLAYEFESEDRDVTDIIRIKDLDVKEYMEYGGSTITPYIAIILKYGFVTYVMESVENKKEVLSYLYKEYMKREKIFDNYFLKKRLKDLSRTYLNLCRFENKHAH